MTKTDLRKLAAAGLCICILTGCGSNSDVKPETSKPAVSSGANAENTKDSSETGTNDLLDFAQMLGTVLEFTDSGCSVSQAKEYDGGAGLIEDAAGAENKDNGVSVTYNSGCEFVIATVNAQYGVTNVTTGSISDVKKQSKVYLYGEFADTLHFNASKVVIAHWE